MFPKLLSESRCQHYKRMAGLYGITCGWMFATYQSQSIEYFQMAATCSSLSQWQSMVGFSWLLFKIVILYAKCLSVFWSKVLKRHWWTVFIYKIDHHHGQRLREKEMNRCSGAALFVKTGRLSIGVQLSKYLWAVVWWYPRHIVCKIPLQHALCCVPNFYSSVYHSRADKSSG